MLLDLHRFLLTAAPLAMLAGCHIAPELSTTPEIGPKSVDVWHYTAPGGARVDTVAVTITWADGDGDLGKADSTDNTRSYFVTIYKQVGTEFKEIVPSFAGAYNGIIPNLAPDDKARPLRGDLRYLVNGKAGFILPGTVGTFRTGGTATLRFGDVIRFNVYVVDRAGHRSNTITTQQITL